MTLGIRPFSVRRASRLVVEQMDERDMSVGDVAEEAGVSYNTVRRVINQETVRVETLQAILGVFSVELVMRGRERRIKV